MRVRCRVGNGTGFYTHPHGTPQLHVLASDQVSVGMVRVVVPCQRVPCGVLQPEMQIPMEVRGPQQKKNQHPQQKKNQPPEVAEDQELSTVGTFDTLAEIGAQ